jgi:1-acyl-sn-glycerol-3-phosphate acyltransferase
MRLSIPARVALMGLRGYLRLRFRVRLAGQRHLPDGPCVLCANHVSRYDPLLLAVFLPRIPRYLAASELWGPGGRWRVAPWAQGVVRWALREARAITVDRDQRDVPATLEALRALRRGDWVAVHPEGGIRGDRLHRGGAWLARTARVPLVPVRIVGLPASGWRPRVTVTVLPPLQPDSTEDAAELARRAWAAIQGGIDDAATGEGGLRPAPAHRG